MTSQAFIKELQRLINAQPKIPTKQLGSENCEECDYVYNSKNLYNCFDTANSQDSSYLFDSFMVISSMDCDYAVECELCYECVDPYICYNCIYIDSCSRLRDSSYCYACWDGNNLFGCSNLRNKSFCIFNRQFTEEEYFKEVEKYKNLPAKTILKMLDSVAKTFPVTQTNEGHNENTTYGNYIYDNKDSYLCFDAARNFVCSYLYDSFDNKNCMDMTYSINSELSYQMVDTANMFESDFCVCTSHCQDSRYLFNCFQVKNSLGCVGIRYKEFCILNRQFTEEEYKKKSEEILKVLRKDKTSWNSLIF